MHDFQGWPRRLIALLWLAACDSSPKAPAPTNQPPSNAPATAEVAAPPPVRPAQEEATKSPPIAPPSPGREIEIAPGTLRVGSPTGSANRNPSREADDVELALPGFWIDALPYPNTPEKPPRHSVSRGEARALCEAEGKRLCSEFEWERACKGKDGREYPGDPFEVATCAGEAGACASPEGVFALGTLGREWTSSGAGRGVGDALRSAVVKGAPKDAARTAHRCAARDAATPDSKSESLLFRCCRGPADGLTYPEESTSEPFREQSWEANQLETLLKGMPQTASVAGEFKLFSAEQVSQRLAASSRSQASLAPWLLAPKGLWWSPQYGEQLGVLAGDTRAGAMLIVFYKDVSGDTLFGASYLTRGEHNAILVAYKPDAPREVLFSTCWGCGGEGGAIEIGPDARVRISQR